MRAIVLLTLLYTFVTTTQAQEHTSSSASPGTTPQVPSPSIVAIHSDENVTESLDIDPTAQPSPSATFDAAQTELEQIKQQLKASQDSISRLTHQLAASQDSITLIIKQQKQRADSIATAAHPRPQSKKEHTPPTTIPPEPLSYTPFAEFINFNDTIIINPVLMPFIFEGRVIEENNYYQEGEFTQRVHHLLTGHTPHSFTYNPNYHTPSWATASYEAMNIATVNTPVINHIRYGKHLLQTTSNHIILTSPEIIEYTIDEFGDNIIKDHSLSKAEVTKEMIEVKELDKVGEVGTVTKFKPELQLWFFDGIHTLQLTQNYISPNWHKGGTPNFNLLSVQNFKFNYDDRKHIKWANEIDWRFSLYFVSEDLYNKYRFGEDLVRYTTNFGYRFKERWYYSVNAETRTPLFNNFAANDTTQVSALMSPITFNVGAGIKYEYNYTNPSNKYNKVDLDVILSPVSFNYKYVLNENVDPKRFGIPEGQRSLREIGSRISTALLWDISRFIQWKSSIYYFTNYSRNEAEWENSLNLILTRYISARINCIVRYDDGVDLEAAGSDSYFQINELLSIGFNYRW